MITSINDTLNLFLQISQKLAVGADVEEICRILADGLMETGIDRCSVVVGIEYQDNLLIVGEGMAIADTDPARRQLQLHARHETHHYPTIGRVVSERQALLINDIETDPHISEVERQFMLRLGTLSLVICPMVSRNRVAGYILAEKRSRNGFQDHDVNLYLSLAAQAATAIEMARLVADMERQVIERTQEAENFRGLAENALDAVCMATLGDHRLIYANPAYYALHGYEEGDSLIGHVDDSFALYEESQSISMTTQLTRQGGLRREHTHLRKDGSSFIGLDTVFAVRDQAGQVVALGSIIRDISQQKMMQQRLRDLSDRRTWQFEVITEIAQELSAAPAMEELFRRVVTLVKERFDYYHTHLYLLPERGDTLVLAEGYGEPGRLMKEQGHHIPVGRGLVGIAARTGQPILVSDVSKRNDWLPNPLLPNTRSELAVPIKMGEQVLGVLDVQSSRINGLTDDDQALLLGLCGQIAVAIQNTRILSSVQQLVDERTREVAIFQSLTENASYGVWMATPEGVIQYANRASHQIFGYAYAENQDQREMIGLLVSQFLTPQTNRSLELQIPALLSGGSWQSETVGIRKNGEKFDLLTVVFGIVDATGAPLAVAAISRDISAQKQLEAEQERLNREIVETQQRLIRDLSAPLIPITENILVLPMIGTIDSARAQQIMESLLQGVESYNAEVVIIDITGVPVLDTSVANHLIQMTSAAALLGAKTVLVGIVPSVAQTLVELGIDLSDIITRNNLQGGVEYALRTQGLQIARLRK